eukprot:2618230-Pyramimonas_sp.AAC.1
MEHMPMRYFSMPLTRAAVEFRRPRTLLGALLLVHMCQLSAITALLILESSAQRAVLWPLLGLSVVPLLDEALELGVTMEQLEREQRKGESKQQHTMEQLRDSLWRFGQAVWIYLGGGVYNLLDVMFSVSPIGVAVARHYSGPQSSTYA